MTLILELPHTVEEHLQKQAKRSGVAKESLAIDLLTRSLADLGEPTSEGTTETANPNFWTSNMADSLIRPPGFTPVADFDEWLRNLPTIDDTDEFVKNLEESRRERREMERERNQ